MTIDEFREQGLRRREERRKADEAWKARVAGWRRRVPAKRAALLGRLRGEVAKRERQVERERETGP